MIENNDEAKRSKIWTVVTSVTSVLIIIVAIFLLMKMFTGNPLEGSWTDEDGNMNLKISRDGQMTVTIPASGEGKDTEVPMTYTTETLKNAVQSIGTTFEYSIDDGTLTLTEREYGEQMMFNKN